MGINLFYVPKEFVAFKCTDFHETHCDPVHICENLIYSVVSK